MSTYITEVLREEVNTFIDKQVQRFYEEVPKARELKEKEAVDLNYFKRHTIEIILRLRLKRTADALVIRHFTKTDPKLAKLWAEYTEDEMLHDTLFSSDLEKLGISKEQIYATSPLLATKLLQGYFYYCFEHEDSPLASICSSYFVEYTSQKTQPQWLDKVAASIGTEYVRGARAHLAHDHSIEHTDFVWNVLSKLIRNTDDKKKVFEHLKNLFSLFVIFFNELEDVINTGSKRNTNCSEGAVLAVAE